MEGEAIALSRLGRMFNVVFKMSEKAHTYYRYALELAITLHPRDLSAYLFFKLLLTRILLLTQYTHKWYIEIEQFLKEYQAAKVAAEEALLKKTKEPYIVMLAVCFVFFFFCSLF